MINKKILFRNLSVLWTLVGLAGLWFPLKALQSHAAGGVSNPGVVEISSPGDFDRVIAISDVHGMYSALLELLTSARIIDAQGRWNAGKTLLIVVGDSIDKGPQSVEVLDLWMALSMDAASQGGLVLHLLGNHEAEFLSDPSDDKKAKAFVKELHEKGISLDEMTKPDYPRGRFLLSMPLAARVGKWVFCHSGLLPKFGWDDFKRAAAQILSSGDYGNQLLIGGESILESKFWWSDPIVRSGVEDLLTSQGLFGIVFGHEPTAFGVEGKSAISSDQRLIKIDNGMAPKAGAHPGSILIFTHPDDLTQAAPAQVYTIDVGSERLAPLAPEDPSFQPSVTSSDKAD